MIVDLSSLSPNQVYHTFTQTLIPRPVAWVLSDNGDGSHNLAPFSYFTGVSSAPPILMISVGKKPDGSIKDTWRNVDERGHFVVHIAHRDLAKPVSDSAASLPHGESELKQLRLETVPFEEGICSLPRLKDCRIAFVCEKERIIEIGSVPQGLIFGLVRYIYIDDSVASLEDGRLTVDATQVDPLSRLGGIQFGLFGDVISVPRPK